PAFPYPDPAVSFPRDFTWGVAAAAYQIEGAHDCDGKVPSAWDAFCERPGMVAHGDHGRTACDHYNRFPEDADLIANLGVSAYRLSISWPRVCDEQGRPNEAGLAFYDRLIDAMLERGIEPWVTLFHWDLPLHLQHDGGWLNRETANRFGEYAGLVARRLSDRVKHWFTINEPQVYLDHGHVAGNHAPGLHYDDAEKVRASHHLLLAHGKAAAALRANSKSDAVVGWAPVGCCAIPASLDPDDIDAARRATFSVGEGDGWLFSTTWFGDPVVLGRYPEEGLTRYGHLMPKGFENDLRAIQQPLDFYGANIYQSSYVKAQRDGQPEGVGLPVGAAITMFHWPVTPEALYWGPRFFAERYGLPIYITENGLASMDWVHQDGRVHDTPRIDFLSRYLCEVRDAIRDGVDIRGFFQWSILDNFEWGAGYRMRFGLVYVDYETQRRIPKDSYDWYAKVVASNGAALPAEAVPLYENFGPGSPNRHAAAPVRRSAASRPPDAPADA
ncbi:MAG: GH1 family beta-glucosidase, partial [Planctomycetota bacterium]